MHAQVELVKWSASGRSPVVVGRKVEVKGKTDARVARRQSQHKASRDSPEWDSTNASGGLAKVKLPGSRPVWQASAKLCCRLIAGPDSTSILLG